MQLSIASGRLDKNDTLVYRILWKRNVVHYTSFLYFVGDTPVFSLNTREKWLRLPKAHRSQICDIEQSVFLSRSLAFSILRFCKYSNGVTPVWRLNSLTK